nr:hypothetical protein GCM10020093_038990 [Planobispora longispora]
MFGLAVVAERRAADPILPPRLFGNGTFVLSSLSSLLVGVAMFGAMMFLPQYLQIVKGMSPSGSGLMTLPLVFGLLVSSIVVGRLVSRTGRWKAYPIAGMVLVAVGLYLLSQLHVDSSLVAIGLDITVLGIGLGAAMQMLVLAAQNASPRTDLAVTTSGVTFFRSLGGAVGVAAFGAILSNRLSSELVSLARAANLPPTGGATPASAPRGDPAPSRPGAGRGPGGLHPGHPDRLPGRRPDRDPGRGRRPVPEGDPAALLPRPAGRRDLGDAEDRGGRPGRSGRLTPPERSSPPAIPARDRNRPGPGHFHVRRRFMHDAASCTTPLHARR